MVKGSTQIGSTADKLPTAFDSLYCFSKSEKFIYQRLKRERMFRYCGQENRDKFKGILGSIYQTFGKKSYILL